MATIAKDATDVFYEGNINQSTEVERLQKKLNDNKIKNKMCENKL